MDSDAYICIYSEQILRVIEVILRDCEDRHVQRVEKMIARAPNVT